MVDESATPALHNHEASALPIVQSVMNSPRAMEEKLEAMRFMQGQRQQERNCILQQNPEMFLEMQRLRALHQQQEEPSLLPRTALGANTNMGVVPRTMLASSSASHALAMTPAASYHLMGGQRFAAETAQPSSSYLTRSPVAAVHNVSHPHHVVVSISNSRGTYDEASLSYAQKATTAPGGTHPQSLNQLLEGSEGHLTRTSSPGVVVAETAPRTSALLGNNPHSATTPRISPLPSACLPNVLLDAMSSLPSRGEGISSMSWRTPVPRAGSSLDRLAASAAAVRQTTATVVSESQPLVAKVTPTTKLSLDATRENPASRNKSKDSLESCHNGPLVPPPPVLAKAVSQESSQLSTAQRSLSSSSQTEEEKNASVHKTATRTSPAPIVKIKVKTATPSRVGVRKDPQWLATYNDLKAYKQAHGDCLVPRGFGPNPALASWVAEQRKQFKRFQQGNKTTLTQERIDLLNAVDFSWNAQEAAWNNHYANLLQYKQQFGHCHVPLMDKAHTKLGLWVKEQRRHHGLMQMGRPTHMNDERCQKLNSIGFCWDTHEATWLGHYHDLVEFQGKHGHTRVPDDGPGSLGAWVLLQRRQRERAINNKKQGLTASRKTKLNDLGFDWALEEDASRKRSHSSDSEDTAQLESRRTETCRKRSKVTI